VQARDVTPFILKAIKGALPDIDKAKHQDLYEMIQILEKWDGSFAEDSVPATVYSYWQMYFYRSLFHIQIPDHDEASEAQRMSISDNY